MTAPRTRAGRFRFTPTAGRWWWSDEMFRIHGMEPGDVVPTRDLFLSHVHPADRPRVAEVVAAHGDREARSCEYRLVDLSGVEREVMLAVATDGPGGSVGSSGFLLDAGGAREAAVACRVNEQLDVALASHAAIDQAKGVLMLTYGIDSDSAFAMLRASSQQHNVRLLQLAADVVSAVAGGLEPRARERVDESVGAVLAGMRSARPSAAAVAPLGLHMDRHTDVPTLRVDGCVDLSNADQLSSAISLLVLRGRECGQAVIDLQRTHRVSPALAGVVTTALRRAVEQDVLLTIVAGRPLPLAHARRPARVAG
ncbi:ANTAR domain-containing protein [Cellulomonas sp. P5_C6]